MKIKITTTNKNIDRADAIKILDGISGNRNTVNSLLVDNDQNFELIYKRLDEMGFVYIEQDN